MNSLIENYCELKIIKPNISDWKGILMKYPIEKYYYRALVSLNKYTFKKFTKWSDFESGRFILKYEKKEIDLILNKISVKEIKNINALRLYFMHSLKFISTEYYLRTHTKNINPVEAGFNMYNFIFVHLNLYFNKNNDKMQQSIKRDLNIICNPNQKKLNFKILSSKYNYPKKINLYDSF